jgi:hypothetical protein
VTYQPPRALGLLVGSVLTLWSLAVAYLLFDNGVTSGVGPVSFVSYVGAVALAALAALFGFWTYSLLTLAYEIDRNGLLIQWGPTIQVIPLGAIERLVPGTAVGVPPVRGISWWGHHVGRAEIERVGPVLFYSTHQAPEQVLYVMTAERNYAISVEDPAAFAREILLRQDLGPTATVSHHVERHGPAAQAFWNDPLGRALALVAVAAGVLVWAQVVLRYPSLPPTLDVHFPPGETLDLVTVSTREALFDLPRSATAMLALNLVVGMALHGWERVAGYVLFIAAAVVQVAFFAAVAIALA